MGAIDELKYNKAFPIYVRTTKKFSREELRNNYEVVAKTLEDNVDQPAVLFIRNIRILKSYFIYLRKDTSGYYGECNYFDLASNSIKKHRISVEVTALISLQQRLIFLKNI